MSCAMGAFAFNPVLPALGGPVNDSCGLAVFDPDRQALSGEDLLEIHALGHVDHIPVMKVGQFHWSPLHVVAWLFAFAANLIRINRSLVPIHVENGVFQGCGTGCSQGFAYAARSHASLSVHKVDVGSACSVIIRSRESEPQGTGN